MSIRLQSQVWEECTDVSGTKLLLLLALADFADDQCQCFPKIKTLAGRIRTDERVTRKHMKELKRLGYVEVLDDSSGRRSNVYKVHVNPVKKDRSKLTGQKRQVTSDRSNPVKFDRSVLLRNIEPSSEPPITPQTPQGAGGMSYKDTDKDNKKDTNVSKKTKRATVISDDWNPVNPDYATDFGINNTELAIVVFRDWGLDSGLKKKDWDRTWQRACREWLPKKVREAEANIPATPTEPEPQYFEPANRIDILKVFPDRTDLVDKPWSELTPDVQQVITEKCKEL